MKNLNEKFEYSEIINKTIKGIPEGMEFSIEENDEGELTSVCKLSESFDVSQEIYPWSKAFCDTIKENFPDEHIYPYSRVELSIDLSQHTLESYCFRLNCYAHINAHTNDGKKLLFAANEAKIFWQIYFSLEEFLMLEGIQFEKVHSSPSTLKHWV